MSTLARCAASNFRWEQAVSDARAEAYHAYIADVPSYPEWKAEHKGYVWDHVQVAKDQPRSAECFLPINVSAHLNEQLDNTYLLRLESMERLFSNPLVATLTEAFWLRFYNSQKDLRKGKVTEEAEALIGEFVAQWNGLRTDGRPLFATFLNDFGGDLQALLKQDWPHLLRDRLGLTHYPSTVGKPLPVALIGYTLDEVREARLVQERRGAVASFTRPTVLDGEHSAAFVPAPASGTGVSYGHTLDLANTAVPDSFTTELLTFPIDYLPRHIKALGFISRPHALQEGDAILAARNRHIQGLQALPGCASFGEVLP